MLLTIAVSALPPVAEGGGGFNPLDLAGGGGIFWTWIIFATSEQ